MRSARNKKPFKKVLDDKPEESETDSKSDVGTPNKSQGQKRKAKKAKSKGQPAAKKLRGDRGRLEALVDMPLDILYEIFGQLAPVGLLNLSRTTKALRSILMSRSSISIWKTSLERVKGLPKCPPDLEEPEYVDLVFGRSCSRCQRNLPVQHTVWASRLRLCTKCLEKSFTECEDSHYSLTEDKRGYPETLACLLPRVGVKRQAGNRVRIKVYLNTAIDAEWREEYKSRTGRHQRKWLAEKIAEYDAIDRHARLCKDWVLIKREEDKESLFKERQAIIMERLKEAGWSEEISKLDIHERPENKDIVVKACQKELTDQVLESLDQHLDGYMQGLKCIRLIRERNAFYKERLNALGQVFKEYVETQPAHLSYPNITELYLNSIVKDVVEKAESLDTFMESLHVLRNSFPEIIEEWRQDIHQQLFKLASDGLTAAKVQFDPDTVMDLATTTFRCDRCYKILSTHESITHPCARHWGYYSSAKLRSELAAVKEVLQELPWNATENIEFYQPTLQRLHRAWHLCGFDPKTLTVAQLKNIDPIIECSACSTVHTGRATMRWQGMPTHFGVNRRYGQDHTETFTTTVLDDEEAQHVRSRMNEEQQRKSSTANEDCICVHCRQPGRFMGLLQHVKENHHIDQPQHGVDVIFKPEASLYTEVYYLWPPKL